jgi:Leucine-rich repeat (LRR) protein
MKRLYPLLFISVLIYWGCEEEQPEEVDTTPPTVSISSHSSGQIVNEIVTIIVTTQDNEGISKVEFFIDDSLVLTDTESPYQYDWNTTQYEDNSEHIVKVISYDNSDNSTESQPIMLTVDNSTSVPNGGNITSVTYTLTEMTVEWEESTDGDFKDYKVLYSDTESGDRDTLETYTDKSTTSYTTTEFDPLIENWFWVQVTDTLGLSSLSNGYMVLDSPPTPSVLYPITYNDGFEINWSQNNDDDFVSYKLYESLSEDMSNQTLVYETDDRTETTYLITIEVLKYYQITIEDVWGLQSTSNIEVGDYDVELWGNSYSVLNTTELDLSNNQLTGSIPPEIGNLTNLTQLYLYHNQLTGSIPSEIGNLTNLTELNLYNNQLTGSIPSEIGNLTNLIELNLYDNQLTGEIPESICD